MTDTPTLSWFGRLLHRFNVVHSIYPKQFRIFECVQCGKIADADCFYNPYNWRYDDHCD